MLQLSEREMGICGIREVQILRTRSSSGSDGGQTCNHSSSGAHLQLLEVSIMAGALRATVQPSGLHHSSAPNSTKTPSHSVRAKPTTPPLTPCCHSNRNNTRSAALLGETTQNKRTRPLTLTESAIFSHGVASRFRFGVYRLRLQDHTRVLNPSRNIQSYG